MVDRPIRVQRQRIKGWRMPPNTVSVTRPGRWGNPFVIGQFYDAVEEEGSSETVGRYRCEDAADAVACFRDWITAWGQSDLADEAKRELRGKNLACWCQLDQPCHADVLLEMANA